MSQISPLQVTGRIFDIQRFSIHDGPGIRTTVFMKGCPLRCAWCHNPEGASHRRELSFIADRCIGCGYCFRVCPRNAHQMADGKHVLDRATCELCGSCTRECYAKALEMVGRDTTVGDVLAEVLRDKPFYQTSGGGMTLSGGEPLAQAPFAEALLAAARDEGLHTCIETCGQYPWETLDRVRGLVDLFLFDFKEVDPQRHRDCTGVDNLTILANLRRLHDAGSAILLRCPIIPGLNDRDEHFDAIRRLAGELANLTGVELLAYHRLGEGKIDRFGLSHETRAKSQPPAPEVVKQWKAKLAGVKLVGE